MATRRKKADVDAALKAVTETDIKKRREEISDLQTKLQGDLASINVMLAEKYAAVQDLDTVLDAKRNELSTIHEIEVHADTLDEISANVEKAQEEYGERLAAHERELEKAKQLRDEEWRREEEAHAFDIQQRDKRDAVQFRAALEERQRQEQIRKQDFDRSLAERVAAVEAREQHMDELETKVANIDQQIEEAVTAAVDKATKQLQTGFSHERTILKKDAEAAVALATQREEALRREIDALQSQLTSLEAQLNAARTDSRAIATAAVEASSQRQALSTLQESIKTQSQGQQQRGR